MAGVDELENVLGSRQVFQAMESKIPELDPWGQLVDQELLRRADLVT